MTMAPRSHSKAALQALAPVFVGPELDLYDVTDSPAFEMDKILYFGLSVFWRGAVHSWESTVGLKAPPIELSAHEEPLRRFLMGQQAAPEDVVLTVDIWHARTVLQAAYVPTASQSPECQRYWFYIPGIIFPLYLGGVVPSGVRLRDARKNIVGVDVIAINSIWDITKSRIQSQEVSTKMKQVLDEVAAIRGARSPTS